MNITIDQCNQACLNLEKRKCEKFAHDGKDIGNCYLCPQNATYSEINDYLVGEPISNIL